MREKHHKSGIRHALKRILPQKHLQKIWLIERFRVHHDSQNWKLFYFLTLENVFDFLNIYAWQFFIRVWASKLV